MLIISCYVRVARISGKSLRVMFYSGKACCFHVLSLAVFPQLISARDRKLGCGSHLWLWRLECKLRTTLSAQHQFASIPVLYTRTIGLRPLHRNRGPAVAAPDLPAHGDKSIAYGCSAALHYLVGLLCAGRCISRLQSPGYTRHREPLLLP